MSRSYYDSGYVKIYPSANATDGGQSNTENNLRKISSKFTYKNFIIKSNEENSNFEISSNEDFTEITVSKGKCCIEGYDIEVTSPITITNNVTENPPTILVMTLNKDGDNLVRGDGQSIVNGVTKIKCRGISVELTSDSSITSTGNTLVLGKYVNGQWVLDDSRYSFIDINSVVAGDVLLVQYIEDKLYDLSSLHLNDESSLSLLSKGKLIYRNFDDSNDIKFTDYNGQVLVGSGIQYDITDQISKLNNRTQVSISGGTTLPDSPAGLTFVGLGYTDNGKSNKLARADHNHDQRYICRSLSEDSSDDDQLVDSPLTVSGRLKSKSLVAGSSIFTTINDRAINISKIQDDSHVPISLLSSSVIGDKLNLSVKGTVTADKVFNAVWNDIAELYEKEDPNDDPEEGTVICKVKGKSTYRPSTYIDRFLVVGVVSKRYGQLLGGDEDKSEEENLDKYYPVSLAGRVPVKVAYGYTIHEGDLLVASDNGRAVPVRPNQFAESGCIVGKSLEESRGNNDTVLAQIFLK